MSIGDLEGNATLETYGSIRYIYNYQIYSNTKHEGYTFKILKSKLQYMEYNETIGISLPRAEKYITRSLNNLTTRHTATKTAWVTHKPCVNINVGIPVTKLDFYYEKTELFSTNKKQKQSVLTVNNLCACHSP